MAEADVKQCSLVDSTHSIRWEVTRQMFDNCQFPNAITSPPHTIEIDGEKSEWYLAMHPKGDDDTDKNNVVITLAIVDSCEGKKFNVRFQVGIETSTGCFPYGDQIKKLYSKEKFVDDNILAFELIKNEKGAFCDSWGQTLCATEEFYKHFEEDKVFVVATFVIYADGYGYRDDMEVVEDYVSDIRSASSLTHLSDFTLVSGKKRFRCHKVLLASRSKYFEALFRNEPTKKVLKVDESPALVEALLKFVNKGVIPKNIDADAMDLILMSDFYGLKRLTVACEKSLVNNLSTDNALETLVTIDKINHVSKEEHRQKVLTYIKKEASKIVKKEDWKKFIQNYPDLITEIVLLNS